MPSSRLRSMARRAISTGCWPGTIGRVGTSICSPRTLSCSCAAGRRTSSEAIRTRFFSLVFSRRAILAVVVVLPEPCRPTMRIGTGGTAIRLSGDSFASSPSPPLSISTRASWTILTTCWPGVTERKTSEPTARWRTLSMNDLTTGNATSASSSATRTSRSAALTSPSLSDPRLRRRSKISPKRPLSPSNIVHFLLPSRQSRRDTQNAPVRETRGLAGTRGHATRLLLYLSGREPRRALPVCQRRAGLPQGRFLRPV